MKENRNRFRILFSKQTNTCEKPPMIRGFMKHKQLLHRLLQNKIAKRHAGRNTTSFARPRLRNKYMRLFVVSFVRQKSGMHPAFKQGLVDMDGVRIDSKQVRINSFSPIFASVINIFMHF